MFHIISQNVRGFKKKQQWFQDFKKKNKESGNFPTLILLQETHINSEKISNTTQQDWNVKNGIYREKNSIWCSVSKNPEQGVAILTNPHMALEICPILKEYWNPRFIAIQWKFENKLIIIINIYASNSNKERKQFFKDLIKIPLPKYDFLIVGGDFNFTENNTVDRIKNNPSSVAKNEKCQEFQTFKAWFKLEDPLQQTVSKNINNAKYMTFFGPHGSARLDRFYISSSYKGWVADIQTRVPSVDFDHKQLWLTLKNPATNIQYKIAKKFYPQHWSKNRNELNKFQEKLKFLLLKLEPEMEKKNSWDNIKREIRFLLIETKIEYAAKHASVYTEKIKKMKSKLQGENNIYTVKQVQEDISKLKKEKKTLNNEIRYRNYLLDPNQGYKNLFKRMSDREINPIIPELKGEEQLNENRMASKWQDLMGKKHSTRNTRRWYKKCFNKYKWKQVSSKNSKILETKINQQEISKAIDQLKKLKAGGDDGLPNDFYKDNKEVMIPVLENLFNKLWEKQ